jgi:monofunctional biosynthetic peptidoglycan transglycosylase
MNYFLIKYLINSVSENRGKPVNIKNIKEYIKRSLKAVYLFHILFAIAVLMFCAFYAVLNPEIGTLMLYRKINNHYRIKPITFISLKKIPRPIVTMVIAAEDYRFYEHWGIDIDGIKEALFTKDNLEKKYIGGSTITQQLARTLFLVPNKSFTRKYFEILIAIEMDALMKKDRILELYLNTIEWGKGIFGIENAALHYYKKSVDELSLDEMIRLVTIMPSPLKYNPDNFNSLRSLSHRYDFLNEVMGLTNIESAGEDSITANESLTNESPNNGLSTDKD